MSTDYTFFSNLSDLVPKTPEDSIISRTVFEDDRLKAVLFRFAEGQELSEHTASQPAMLHFIQGSASLTLGKDEMSSVSGSWAYMPARLSHSIKALSELVMLLLLMKPQP